MSHDTLFKISADQLDDLKSIIRDGDTEAAINQVDAMAETIRQTEAEIAEDLADAGLSARIMAETRPEDLLPADLVHACAAGEIHPIQMWAKHRGMTLIRLAAASGVKQPRISEIINAKSQGTMATWQALAAALEVQVDDLLP